MLRAAIIALALSAQAAHSQDFGAFDDEGTSGSDERYNDGSIPPSWRIDRDQPRRTRKRPRNSDWYLPRFALGVGLNVPELLPLEGYVMLGKYVALRAFYTPILPFNIRIEMPADVISTKKGIGVANPDFTIRMKAEYGAHYGAEALVFPFGKSMFLAGGVSHRRMRLRGNASSPILVCSLIEAAKNPPCSDPDARIQTQTELQIAADATTTALLGRAAIGGFWHVGRYGYFMMNLGYTKPLHIRRDVKVTAGVNGPSSDDPDISGAIAEVIAEREEELRQKALAEMRPVEEKPLPIFGIAAGIRL